MEPIAPPKFVIYLSVYIAFVCLEGWACFQFLASFPQHISLIGWGAACCHVFLTIAFIQVAPPLLYRRRTRKLT
jgi:hypothetical protein